MRSIVIRTSTRKLCLRGSRLRALVSAAKKHYGEEADIVVKIDREDGSIHATHEGRELDSEETVGRIGGVELPSR